MARKPNYNFERRERERAKAAKKAAKAEEKRLRKAASNPDRATDQSDGPPPESD